MIRLAGLRGELERWQESLEDELPWRVEEPKPSQVILTGRKRDPDRWQPAWIVEKYFNE